MKTKLLTICLLLFTSQVFADPAYHLDDWHLIDEMIQDKLIDEKSNIELLVENSSLVLKSKKFIFFHKKEVIYDFANKNHDVYLIQENDTSYIYVFNHEDKKLYKSKLNNANFQELKWEFNSLMGMIRACGIKEASDFFLIDVITDNSFLTKYIAKDRPNAVWEYDETYEWNGGHKCIQNCLRCAYYIGGGRCSFSYSSYDMMIVNNSFNYAGDLISIGSIYDIDEDIGRAPCEFYKKISFTKK
jgi:hypothetical protein